MEIKEIITMVANNGLAIVLCIYYTVSYTRQLATVINKLDLLTEEVSVLIKKER